MTKIHYLNNGCIIEDHGDSFGYIGMDVHEKVLAKAVGKSHEEERRLVEAYINEIGIITNEPKKKRRKKK